MLHGSPAHLYDADRAADASMLQRAVALVVLRGLRLQGGGLLGQQQLNGLRGRAGARGRGEGGRKGGW